MADKATEEEPSIEEILASIRQIISDDDEDAAEDTPPAPKAAPPEPDPAPEEEEDDVLELTDIVEKKNKPEPEPEPEPKRVEIDMREAEDEEDDGSILTENAASATLEGFARLASNMAIDRTGTGALTLEDIVRELMRPMLREWLDVHLPPLIEKLVQKELDRLARKAMDDD